MKTRLSIAAAMLVLPTLMIAPTFAQTPPAIQALPAAQKPMPPKTLEEGLNAARWDATKWGVLIALAPEEVKPVKDAPSDALTASQGRDGYNVTALGEYFGRRVQRFGGVTVLAPPTMVVLNPHPAPPDFTQIDNPSQRNLFCLLPTLTALQWQMIGSTNGIGMADLTGQQQRIFDGLIENPLIIARASASDYASRTVDQNAMARFAAAPRRTLTPGERAAVRVRLKMTSIAVGEAKQDPNSISFIAFNGKLFNSKGETYLIDRSQKPEKQGNFGVLLSSEVPNRLKKGDLNYESLTVVIKIESSTEKPLTVETLVGQIAEANDLNLIVDKRIAQKKIGVRGMEARSSDLLKSLCFAVSGSLRKVGDVYLLTSDIEGIGTRRALVDDWKIAAEKAQSDEFRLLTKQLRAKAQKLNPTQYLSFDESDPLKLSPEIVQQVISKRVERKGIFGYRIKSDALSPEARTFLTKKADDASTQENSPRPTRADEFQVDIAATSSLIVPGIGEVEDQSAPDIATLNPNPDEVKPPIVKGKILLLHPLSSQAAETAVQKAAKMDAAGLWIETTMTTSGLQILKKAIAAGEKEKIPISTVVRLMRDRTTNAPSNLLDCNIRGETSDWLVPDLPPTYNLLQAALTGLARVPHLAGIILVDALPPGYRSRAANFANDNPSSAIAGCSTEQGYRLQSRLEFLQAQGADPIDLVTYFFGGGTNIPFFLDADSGDAIANAWTAWRNDRAVALLTKLRATIERVHPGIPVFIHGEITSPFRLAHNDQWYVQWDADSIMPRAYRHDVDAKKPLAPQVRGKSNQVFVYLDGDTMESRNDFPPPDPTGSDGTVIDLSNDTITDAFAKLEPK